MNHCYKKKVIKYFESVLFVPCSVSQRGVIVFIQAFETDVQENKNLEEESHTYRGVLVSFSSTQARVI